MACDIMAQLSVGGFCMLYIAGSGRASIGVRPWKKTCFTGWQTCQVGLVGRVFFVFFSISGSKNT